MENYGDNSILGGVHLCNCALPAMNGGSTECCKHCINFSRDWKKEWENYQEKLYKGSVEFIYDKEGHLIKIIYNN